MRINLAPMSFLHELTRRELQMKCKEYGLPANKSNAVMASSLTSFLGDPRTNIMARAPQNLTPPMAKKAIKARAALLKPERMELSIAALILEAASITNNSRAVRTSVGQSKLLKKRREMPEGRKPMSDLSAFFVSSPTKLADSLPLPKTAPLRRRRKNCTEDTTYRAVSADPTENLRLRLEEISIQNSGRAVKKELSPEPHIVPVLYAADLDTVNEGSTGIEMPDQHEVAPSGTSLGIVVEGDSSVLEPSASSSALDQDGQNKSCRRELVHPALSPLLRITANVDALIRRVTGMLENFEKWKIDNPSGDVGNASGQMQLYLRCEQPSAMDSSLDKENHCQPSPDPHKNLKSRILQAGYMAGKATQLNPLPAFIVHS